MLHYILDQGPGHLQYSPIAIIRMVQRRKNPSIADTPEAGLAVGVICQAIEDLQAVPVVNFKAKHWKPIFHEWRRNYESAHRLFYDPEWRPTLEHWCDSSEINIDWLLTRKILLYYQQAI